MASALLLSQGFLLLLGGELSWTQGGNNNAYCQDNGAAWYDDLEERNEAPRFMDSAATRHPVTASSLARRGYSRFLLQIAVSARLIMSHTPSP